MYLKSIEIAGFKSFAKKDTLAFSSAISAIVGPNGSGKSNVAEAFRFVLGEQSMKSMRTRKGEDLIYNGSPSMPRANRASVKVVFDNSSIGDKRILNIDFDEVSIERTVHRDGINQYSLNGSSVRLRDTIELLASANIGSSGHHIISQGEADRILNTSSVERREMIEDGLGLKIFQYKKQESEKKLLKTEENIEQVHTLRKEILPHLSFLKRQMEKMEKTANLREKLIQLYREYAKRETLYVANSKGSVAEAKRKPEEKLSQLEKDLEQAKKVLASSDAHNEKSNDLIKLKERLADARNNKDETARALGRIEGQISFEESRITEIKRKSENVGEDTPVSLSKVKSFHDSVLDRIKDAEDSDKNNLKKLFSWIREEIERFFEQHSRARADEIDTKILRGLQDGQKELSKKLKELTEKEGVVLGEHEKLQKELDTKKDETFEAEREVFRIMNAQSELRVTLETIRSREEKIITEEEALARELAEAVALIGVEIKGFEDVKLVDTNSSEISEDSIISEERSVQEERHRELEKLKIRIEEAGAGNNEEILKEYKDVSERDEFFARELADLEKSAELLRGVINDLEEKLNSQFKEGIAKINTEFQKFFALLFDGGTAGLVIERLQSKTKKTEADALLEEENNDEVDTEEERVREGISVSVSLPHKRIKSLEMLSGGERALTSIALIFAISQVNPPPFIILDETDAALDEANSKRYGDMIESLSERSQLILITHNRETMSRAGILYGITMGKDGISKLLSVKLDEAVAVAK